jgi:hypothetical protein
MALIPYEKTAGDKDPPLTCSFGPIREMYCGDPRCDCLTGHLLVGGTPLAVDVGTGRLDFLDMQTSVLREPLLAELRELVADQGVLAMLRAHYVAVRRYGEEHNYEHEDWTKLEPGELVPWQALFPQEGVELLPILKEIRPPKEGEQVPDFTDEDIAFRLGLGDAYCVDPRCDCHRVLWTVVAMAKEDRDMVRQLGTVVYDFRRRQPAVQAAVTGVDPDQLLYTVLMALRSFPGVIDAHAERYRRLRQLLIPLIQRQRRENDAGKASLTREAGRNDPCPCGSGKKYKKCHGAKPPTAKVG